jgi:hypothetical protein
MAIIDNEENPSKNTVIYYYDAPGDDNDAIIFNGLLMKQKDTWLSLGSISGRETVRLCRVPEMEFLRDPSETVEQALDENMEKYQRPTDRMRRDQIRTFFGQNENYLVNSSIIWLPSMGESLDNLDGQTGKKETWDYHNVPGNLPVEDQKTHPNAKGIKTYRIQTEAYSPTSDPRNIILQTLCEEPKIDDNGDPITEEDGTPATCSFEHNAGYWFDVCPSPECTWNGRPGHLIDGQHRSRGVAASANPDERIPINVMEGDSFDENQRSKIFSEVNNNGEKLKDLHRLNLAYRTDSAVNVASWSYNFDEITQKRSYQVAAKLTSGSPHTIMKERIHLLPPSPGRPARRGKMLSVDQFVRWSATSDANYSSNWFNPNGPWRKITNPALKLSANNAALSLSNFYRALSARFPTPLWENATSQNGHLQQKWIVQPVFKMYPLVVSKIRGTHAVDVPTIPQFTEVLDYLQNISFLPGNWKNFNSGVTVSGQPGLNHRAKILRALVGDFASGMAEIPDSINKWIGMAPRFENLTSTRTRDIQARGTTLEWVSSIDAIHHSGQNCDESPLLSQSGLATISIHYGGELVYEKTEAEMSHIVDPEEVEDDSLNPGDTIEITVSYGNISGVSHEENLSLQW